jgi:UDP-N-acetylmuramyl pentapeptide synthase
VSVKIYRDRDRITLNESDLLIHPVHLAPTDPIVKEARLKGVDRISHHEAVKEIVEKQRQRCIDINGTEVIEITGTLGKTSTSEILFNFLDGNGNVLLHNSRHILFKNELGSIEEHRRASIAPSGILEALNVAKKHDFCPDYAIFEVSLGGTGLADVGVITTLREDYPIASKTAMASSAKMKMINNAKKGCILVLNTDINHRGSRVKVNTFSDSNSNSDNVNANPNVRLSFSVQKEKGDVDILFNHLNTLKGRKKGGAISFVPNGSYIFYYYIIPILASVTSALSLGGEGIKIGKKLENFNGVEGRMVVKRINGRILVDNSNCGARLNGSDFDFGIKRLNKTKNRVVLVVGGESNVCEGFSAEKLLRLKKEG